MINAFKKVLLLAACVVGLSTNTAQAQNVICTTAASGTSDNRCASTAFVQNAVSAALPLANGKILVGNASNLASPVFMSGDGTLNNTGVLSIANVLHTWTVLQQFNDGEFALKGSSSGTLVQHAAAAAGSSVLTWPAGTTDFSATGAAHNVVKQSSAGAPFTVGQLACADLSDSSVGCSASLALTQYHFFIGSSLNQAADTALGGDCTYTTSYGIVCTKSNNTAFGAMAFLTSTASGDLSGTWPNITVAKVQGLPYKSGASYSANQVPTWNSGTNQFEPGAGTAGRTVLSGATTFYVNPSASPANCNGVTCGGGSDVTGDGSLATPWATRTHATVLLRTSYDLACQIVTIQLADGTYTDSFQFFGPLLFGQCSPQSLIYNGNDSAPNQVLIQPLAGLGYTYGFFFGFSAEIKSQWLDQTNQYATPGQDIVSIGQGSIGYIANDWIGCAWPSQGQNAFTFANLGQLFVVGGTTIKLAPGLCQQTTTATASGSSSTLTLASTTGIHGIMGISGTNIPQDAYIASLVSTTATLGCVITSPCQTSGSLSGTTVTIYGGGQFFFNGGNTGIVSAVTNGESDFSVISTIANPVYYTNFALLNTLSSANLQALTFINPGFATGGCAEVVNISVMDTKYAGVPYFPCIAGPSAANVTTTTLSSGSNSFTVSGGIASRLKVGMLLNGYGGPTGTWTAGSSTITLSSATGVCIGGMVSGPGILAGSGAVISNLVSTTATLTPCAGGAGSQCVGGYATYLPETGAQLAVTGCGLPNGTWITGVSGSTITTNNPANASGAQVLITAPVLGATYTGVQDSSVYH